jgi:hypothetical protein
VKASRAAPAFNIFWPVAIILIAAYWLVRAAGALPPAVLDISDRSLPVLLVAFGLILLVGRRVRYGNVIALVVCALLVGGVTAVAYTQRGNQFSTAYKRLFPATALPANVKNIKITISTLGTQVEIQHAVTGQRGLSGLFEGSQESAVDLTFAADTNTYTFTETHLNSLPLLISVGKGKLTLQLPDDVIIDDLTFNGHDGDLTFDASTSTITSLNLTLGSGNMDVRLSDKPGLIGNISTGHGDVTLQVPTTADAQINLFGGGAGNPTYDNVTYLFTRDNQLKPQRDPANPKMQIKIDTSGHITIKTPES